MKFVTLLLLYISIFTIAINAARHLSKRKGTSVAQALTKCQVETCDPFPNFFKYLYYSQKENFYICECFMYWYKGNGKRKFDWITGDESIEIKNKINEGTLRQQR